MTIAAALFSSERDDWASPEPAIAPARLLGPIVLDPCSNAQSIVHAQTEYRLTRGQDGLRDPWFSDGQNGVCWVNCPYGRRITILWTARMLEMRHRGVQQVGLLPSRTDTEWFHEHIAKADAICFWEGRLDFIPAISDKRQLSLFGGEPELGPEEEDEAAPFASIFPYFGERREDFKRAYSPHGLVVYP